MPAFKRDSASRLRDAERGKKSLSLSLWLCMKGGEPLTMREASFISSLMRHAATVRFTMPTGCVEGLRVEARGPPQPSVS